jgi:dTMP kinase
MFKRGRIFVVEGTDCSGKGTQTDLLVARLKAENILCHKMSFPRYDTPTGDMLKRYLGKPPYQQEFGPSDKVNPKLASVLYAEDRYATRGEMLEIINNGIHLILDRYVESNMGHQGGKIRNPKERLEFIKWLDNLEYGTFELPRPDKVIFLYMPHQVAIELKKSRPGEADGHEANPEHLRNAEENYLQLANLFGWKRIDCAPDGTIKSLRTREDISKEVYKIAMGEIKI